MIQLVHLRWSNWFSYGIENEIHFNKDTITQILGGNGAGKSSIPLILEEVLFNKNSKKIKKGDILNRNTDDKYYSAILTFIVNEDEYQLSVMRKGTLKVILKKNGEDISSHTTTNTYKTIQKILGLNFDVFSQLIYQSTSSSLNFLTATDATRKNFLSSLFKLDHYQTLGRVFNEDYKEAELDKARLNGMISAFNKDLVKINTERKKLGKYQKSQVSPLSYEEELIDLNRDLGLLHESKGRLEASQNLIKSNNLKKAQLLELGDKVETKELEQLTPYDITIGQSRAVIAMCDEKLDKMADLGINCPTCYQQVNAFILEDLIRDAEDTKERNEELLEKAVLGKKQGLTYNKETKEQNNKNSKIDQLRSEIDFSLPTEVASGSITDAKINIIQDKLSALAKMKDEIAKHNDQVENHNNLVDKYKNDEILKKRELEEIIDKYKILEEKSTNLEILKKAFGTNGLIAYKIENLTFHLQKLINSYLEQLSGGRFTLAFKAQKDKLNITLTDEGKEITIQALSSGELARVNCATLLGIRSLMGSISKAKINLLILDEVINVLDVEGRQTLVELLWNEPLNTFLVSHAWTHPLLQKVEVKKEEGFSKVIHE